MSLLWMKRILYILKTKTAMPGSKRFPHRQHRAPLTNRKCQSYDVRAGKGLKMSDIPCITCPADHQCIRPTLTTSPQLAAICLCVVLKTLSACCLPASGELQRSRRLLLRSCCCSLAATEQREVLSERGRLTAD